MIAGMHFPGARKSEKEDTKDLGPTKIADTVMPVVSRLKKRNL